MGMTRDKGIINNLQQMKNFIVTVCRWYLANTPTIIIKEIAPDKIVIPHKTQTEIETAQADGKTRIYYNTTEEQFEGWIGTDRRGLG